MHSQSTTRPTHCTVDGCSSPVKGHGLCLKHYQRWVKHGDPLYERATRVVRSCVVDGCSSPVLSRGLCAKHYQRQRTHGDPLHERPARPTHCTVEGCFSPVHGQGLCDKHHARMMRHGDPLVDHIPGPSMEDRFRSFVNKDGPPHPYDPSLGPCWLWTGGTTKKGYGIFMTHVGEDGRGESTTAHRVAWTIANGPLPAKLLVRHSCDRVACVNPAHLLSGTYKDNAADMDSRGRRVIRRHGVLYHQLSDDAVREIRVLAAQKTLSQEKIAAQFGVHQTVVSRIHRRTGYRHVT